MSETSTEALTKRALESLLRSQDGWRRVVRDMVAETPDLPPLELIFVLVNAASTIEDVFAPGSPSRPAADQAMRLAALLGTDLYAMQALGLPMARAADLLAYWRAHDDFFLTL